MRVMNRLVKANLGMEHYWFFHKHEHIMVPVKQHKQFSAGKQKS